MRKIALLILIATSITKGFAQQNIAPQKSFLQAQQEYYSKFNFSRQEQWDSMYNATREFSVSSIPKKRASSERACSNTKRVFGWNPYWISTAQFNNYDYSLLTDLCYFSYVVDANTGGYTTINSWLTNGAVTNAKNAGKKTHLCATLFANHATFLSNTTSRQNFINNMVSLLQQRNATGCNIDFEAVPNSQSANLTSFIIQLGNALHSNGFELSIALPAVNWSNTWDVGAMTPYVDLFIIMGYDYYYKGSANAGPPAPKNNGGFWSAYDCTRSVVYYQSYGVPNTKLCLAVPYYGYDWPTSSNALNSATTGTAAAVLYYNAVPNANTNGRQWDTYSSTPHYSYNSGGWHQCFYDDEQSLAAKYDMVNIQGLAGIGIWALGYDDGYTQLWDLIKNNFTTCAAPTSCSGNISDMGGPGNYYNDEDWTYTIVPSGASSVSLTFSSFNLENNYDFLSIYAGPSAASPLIGKYTGTNSPGTVTSNNGAITLHYTSDGATVASGWNASWNCTAGQLPIATNDATDCSSIRGWAYDPDVPNTSINVDIYIGGTKVYSGITGTPRPDVNTAFGISGDHGYDLPIPGEYTDGIARTVDVYAINNNGPDVLISSSSLTCGSLVPKFTLDVMDCNELRGWAYDPDVSSSSIDVHLYVDNNMVAAIPTNDSRADVNAAFGISGTHGFVYTVPDLYKDGQTHTFALYAINNDGYNALNSATTFGPCYVIPSGFNAQPNTCPNIGVTLNWQHSANGFFLDIGTDPNFAMGTFFNKDVSSLTSVVCPGGFCEYTGGACNGNYLDFQPNTTYYWRIFNGSAHTSAGSFTTPSCSYVDNSNCSGSFSDMGAGANYTDNEDYTYTYSPPGASSVDVKFTTFGTENGYDFLYLYDGNSTSAPLIGTYTGNTLPNGGNKISSTGGSITMKFHSDPFTNDIGFTGTYSCSQISTSINEANTSELLISPNPSNGVFHITLPKNFTGNASELTVVDVVGKEVLHLVNPEAITVIDLSKKAKGAYLLKINLQGENYYKKIIVQ